MKGKQTTDSGNQHNVTMTTSLISFDGYPRPDIDVAQIRTTRARIIRLKNDYKDLMAKIEVGLQQHWENQSAAAAATPATTAASSAHAAQASSSSAPASSAAAASNTQAAGEAPPRVEARVEVPFAKVNTVVPSSPADTAGLKPGDKVTRFGYVDWMNHEKLSRVAQVVQGNEGREVLVKVIRGDERVEVKLTPRRDWGGRGLLGCHLLPL